MVDGPVTEAKELIAGFWMLQVASLEDAVAWAKRCPFDVDVQYDGGNGEIELRRVYEPADFAYAPEAVAKTAELAAAIEQQQNKA